MSDHRQKAKDLIELACDERAGEKERVSAALKAARIIRKYELLDNPIDGVFDRIKQDETVVAARSVVDTLTNPTLVGNLKQIGRAFSKARRR